MVERQPPPPEPRASPVTVAQSGPGRVVVVEVVGGMVTGVQLPSPHLENKRHRHLSGQRHRRTDSGRLDGRSFENTRPATAAAEEVGGGGRGGVT